MLTRHQTVAYIAAAVEVPAHLEAEARDFMGLCETTYLLPTLTNYDVKLKCTASIQKNNGSNGAKRGAAAAEPTAITMTYIKDMELEGKVEALWAKTKWENLKQKYKLGAFQPHTTPSGPPVPRRTVVLKDLAWANKEVETFVCILGEEDVVYDVYVAAAAIDIRPTTKERPRVSLLQRSPSSPVVCHATGFYPDRVVVFWRRDGQELHEQVDPGEVLPNHDGTFQVTVGLNLTAVPQEDWGRYECVVHLRGIEDISTPLDPTLIRTNWVYKSGITIPIIIGFVVLLLAAAAAVVGFFVYQKRNGSDTSSENTEGQNPAPEAQPLTTVSSFPLYNTVTRLPLLLVLVPALFSSVSQVFQIRGGGATST
ncbi:unnamed protein product [Boreogadus saida]